MRVPEPYGPLMRGHGTATEKGSDPVSDVYRNKVLFIDDAFLLEVHNLERRVNQAVKHPEPVIKLDDPWHDKMEMFNYSNVLHDEHEGLFRMWYVVCGQRPDEYWERGRKTAYATSRDGVHWEKPIMNMVEVNGSKENNYIIPEMLSLTYTIVDDPSEVAPAICSKGPRTRPTKFVIANARSSAMNTRSPGMI